MKKGLLLAIICLLGYGAAYAQKGDITVAAKTTGFDVLFVDGEFNTINLGLTGTYFITDKLAAEAGIMFEHDDSWDLTTFSIGLGARYYVWNNLFAGIGYQGVKVTDIDLASFGLIQVGYDYFFNDKVFIEPALFYGLGLSDHALDTFGLSVSLGVKF